ncbi:MAG: hypothetical protein JNL98_06570 [Bryobacterales bacterium]|nr:hypothetical protein [Bryobacterales bacterium]
MWFTEMSIRIARRMALITGTVLPCIETWRRWRMLSDWPSWADDYIAAALLLYAWHAGRKDPMQSRPYLMAAWGYTLGIAYMSFFGQLRAPVVHDPSGTPLPVVLGFKGLGLAASAVCLALAWTARPNRDA